MSILGPWHFPRERDRSRRRQVESFKTFKITIFNLLLLSSSFNFNLGWSQPQNQAQRPPRSKYKATVVNPKNMPTSSESLSSRNTNLPGEGSANPVNGNGNSKEKLKVQQPAPNRPLPKSITLDTSLVQDIKRSLKILSNDLNIIIDLIDQKLGIKSEDGDESINESTLARRKEEDLQRQKIEKGYVPGNVCKTHVAKDIGSSIIHAGAKVLLLTKMPDSVSGDRWTVNIVGTSRNVNFHELEIQCEAIEKKKESDNILDSEEYRWYEEYKSVGVFLYFRNFFYFLGFIADVLIWTSLQLFLDSPHNKKRRRRVLAEAHKRLTADLSQGTTTAINSGSSSGTSGTTGISSSGSGSGSSGTIGSSSSSTSVQGRLEILLQEDILSKYVDEYIGKVARSIVIAIVIRIPGYVLDTGGIIYSMLFNFIITLRCLAVVTFFLKDDLSVPE